VAEVDDLCLTPPLLETSLGGGTTVDGAAPAARRTDYQLGRQHDVVCANTGFRGWGCLRKIDQRQGSQESQPIDGLMNCCAARTVQLAIELHCEHSGSLERPGF
jgi:hypothetical protein